MKARSMVAVMACLLSAGIARADEIKLMASAALKPAYIELLPGFETATGHKVTAIWSSSRVIKNRISAGDEADVVIVASILGESLIDRLIVEGKIIRGSQAVFARSGVGVAARSGAPRPDIDSVETLRRSLLEAKSVAYSAGASGVYIETMLRRLGIYDEVKSKTTAVKPSEPVGQVVARGDAELGFHQVSELLPVRGIQYLGPLPAEVQNITIYSGGIHSDTKAVAGAKALIDFLTSAPAKLSLQKHGLEN